MDIRVLPLEGDSTPEDLIATDYREEQPAISRNGKWLAYVSNVTGQAEVWVRRYRGSDPPIRISSNGGSEPVWGPEDHEIFFYEAEKLMVASVETEPELAFGKPVVLFEGRYFHSSGTPRSYDVGPDGRLLMIRPVNNQAPVQINVVQNWFSEVKRLVPTE